MGLMVKAQIWTRETWVQAHPLVPLGWALSLYYNSLTYLTGLLWG